MDVWQLTLRRIVPRIGLGLWPWHPVGGSYPSDREVCIQLQVEYAMIHRRTLDLQRTEVKHRPETARVLRGKRV